MHPKHTPLNHSFVQNQNHQNLQHHNQNQRIKDSVVYQQGPLLMANQYMNSQAGYYSQQTTMNAPPTPFDTAYGVTLLPSHLLMGSPFVCSPDLFQQGHQQQNHHHRQPYNHYKLTPSSNRSNSKMANGFPPPPALNAPPASRSVINSRHNSYYQLVQGSANSKLFKEPFMITYTVLPKGNDEYRTRSLLFEHVSTSVDLHSFVSKYSKYGPIESIYLFKDSKDDSKNSILLSFLSSKTCLDSYNSVLRRLSEFKSELNSKFLTLSFVSLKYRLQDNFGEIKVKSGNSIEEDKGENGDSLSDALNVTAAASLHYDIINRGATRSIAISLESPCRKEELFDKKLDFLNRKKNQNKRYVLESVDLVIAKEATRHFPQNYVILTFLNITMAVELLDYVRLNATKFGFEKCFFVSVLPQKPTDGPQGNSSSISIHGKSIDNIGINYGSKNASLSSLDSSGSFVSLNQEIESLSNKLQGIQLVTHTIEIKIENYPEPFFAEHDDHVPYVSISEVASLDFQLSEARPQEMQLNESAFLSRESSISNDASFSPQNHSRQSLGSQALPIQAQMPVDAINSAYYMDSPNLGQSMTKPITQSLQRQYASSVEVASLMGGGVGNRTIYIGNVHPRSKPEDVCNVVRGGVLQNVKFIKEKHICFVTFIEASSAVQFYTNAFIDPIVLHGNMLKVGWGHHSGALPKSIALAVTVGASRNVYVSLPEYSFKDKYINDPQYKEYHEKYTIPTEKQLREDFSQYGDIEQINHLSDGHCCWVNFMNISAAIRLVEEVNNDVGEKFHKKFDNRYTGLIIGYGKDRCGNVNKNLVAGKNSRFYKKVKKPSFNIRLNKMEEERRLNEEALRNQHKNNSDQILQFDSLGITLDSSSIKNSPHTNQNNFDTSNGKAVEQHASENSDQEGEELLKLSNESELSNGLEPSSPNLRISSERNTEQETASGRVEDSDDGSVNSEVSTDIELIIHTPIDEKTEFELGNFDDPDEKQLQPKLEGGKVQLSKQKYIASSFDVPSVNSNPPIAPATISRNYSLMVKNQNRISTEPHQSSEQDKSQKQYQNGHKHTIRNNIKSRPRKNSKKRDAKTIPGSDVMAQYLAQLQHSTFMYAANVLGATGEVDKDCIDDSSS
ncbi:hypothetical protein HG535_0A07800 [Zygotorulaspora mrakii]|uniref:RRM domain-containing protein n=1 Tax=Zygotorulaspora mrakii TaxID=42260 RepID=A0A7H9AXG8_ZYGMR|nr:uncharacterized protein HG535_0A07800 [Zygotorulaspora mrakii]QLG70837.1 hypothetical protein HG535_0A07800 [Zygotorulaspora mrakii]